jgi:cytochrome c
MKKTLIKPSLIVITLTMCLGLSITPAKAQTHHTVHHTISHKPSAAELAEGKALFLKLDCLTCHKMDVKLVGPAYYDVIKKYPPTEANYTLLANKVIAGGSGVWGQIPMAPHPNLTVDDAKKIIKYILSIKPPKA